MKISLTKEDDSRAKQMLAYPWFAHKQWQREITDLLKAGFKMEIEVLSNKDISFVTDVYIPQKITKQRLARCRSLATTAGSIAKIVDLDAVALHPAVDLHARLAELTAHGGHVALRASRAARGARRRSGRRCARLARLAGGGVVALVRAAFPLP